MACNQALQQKDTYALGTRSFILIKSTKSKNDSERMQVEWPP